MTKSSSQSLSNRLRKAASRFRCLSSSSGNWSQPKGYFNRTCPCPGCKAQDEVLEVASKIDELMKGLDKCKSGWDIYYLKDSLQLSKGDPYES